MILFSVPACDHLRAFGNLRSCGFRAVRDPDTDLLSGLMRSDSQYCSLWRFPLRLFEGVPGKPHNVSPSSRVFRPSFLDFLASAPSQRFWQPIAVLEYRLKGCGPLTTDPALMIHLPVFADLPTASGFIVGTHPGHTQRLGDRSSYPR